MMNKLVVLVFMILGVILGSMGAKTALKVHWLMDGTMNNGWLENMTYGRDDLSMLKDASNTNMAMGAHLAEHAIYTLGMKDSDGNKLNPDAVYEIVFEGQIPVVEGGFWSVTSYNGDYPLPLVPNRLNKYSINDGNVQGLSNYTEQGFSFIYSAEKPEGVADADWLPASSSNPLPIFRIYRPDTVVLEGNYVMPTIKRINQEAL